MRDTPGSMAWFGTYEFAKKEMMRIQGIDPATGTLSPLAVLSAGGNSRLLYLLLGTQSYY